MVNFPENSEIRDKWPEQEQKKSWRKWGIMSRLKSLERGHLELYTKVGLVNHLHSVLTPLFSHKQNDQRDRGHEEDQG